MKHTQLKTVCPSCGKASQEISRDDIGGEIWINLSCGHVVIHEGLVDPDEVVWQELLKRMAGHRLAPFPFQVEGVKFAEAADCNALILDEQGLGKTVQECMLLARNPQLLPALIVCKSGLRAQWFNHIFKITGKAAQIITSGKEQPFLEFFDVVIVSVDTLRLVRPDIKIITDWDRTKAEAKGKKLKENKPIWTDETVAKFKHICVDEVQKVKNPGSSRAQALEKIVSISDNGNRARFIGLSGTPIDKHAGEFYPALHFARPQLFSNQSTYVIQHCRINPETGKIGGLKNPERFREITKDFIIRRKRADVMPQLPKVFRQFRLAEMEDGDVAAYIKIVKEFQDSMDDPDIKLSQSDILGYLSRMRHITGVAKVDAACEFVEEFLLENDNDRKLTIFLHHKMAAQILMAKIEQLCKDGNLAPPLYLPGGMQLDMRVAVENEFRKPGNRILIASTLASCEGLNLQFCKDCLFMERQWNPTQEEQAESRFPRPRESMEELAAWGPDDKIMAYYLIAAGTIDDFFTDIVEVKRANVAQTLDGEEMTWDENSLIGELMRAIQTKGLKKWSLS